MKIYLAGKIGRRDWRHQIIPDLAEMAKDDRALDFDVCQCAGHGPLIQCLPGDWPVLPKVIFDQHDYCGPFFLDVAETSKDVEVYGIADIDARPLAGKCVKAIDEADLVFCWITEADAFGTAFEIGYAIGSGKKVAWADGGLIVGDDGQWNNWNLREVWLPLSFAEEIEPDYRHCGRTGFDGPQHALEKYLKKHGQLKQTSFVYFIEAVGLDRIKIGKADDVDRRLSQLKTGTPCELRLLKKLPGSVELERSFHSRFSSLRLNGEWFHAAQPLRNFIASLGS